MKAILYARTSAADAGKSPEDLYLVPLRRQAADRGWDVVAELIDRGPRPQSPRPELERAGTLISEGGIEVFATPRLTHPFRSMLELARIGKAWTDRGIAIVSSAELLDGTQTEGKLRQYHLFTTMAAYLRDVQSEASRVGFLLSRLDANGELGPWQGNRSRVYYNPLEIKTLYEQGLRGKFLSQSAIVRHLKRSKQRISKGLLTNILREMRAAGSLDDKAREELREKNGTFHNGRPATHIGYDEGEIRALIAAGMGARRILRAARSLPKRATLAHVRRIVTNLQDAEAS